MFLAIHIHHQGAIGLGRYRGAAKQAVNKGFQARIGTAVGEVFAGIDLGRSGRCLGGGRRADRRPKHLADQSGCQGLGQMRTPFAVGHNEYAKVQRRDQHHIRAE